MGELTEVQESYGRLKLFIDGKCVDSQSDRTQPIMTSAMDTIIGQVQRKK